MVVIFLKISHRRLLMIFALAVKTEWDFPNGLLDKQSQCQEEDVQNLQL